MWHQHWQFMALLNAYHPISHQNSNTAKSTVCRAKCLRKLNEIPSFSFLLLLWMWLCTEAPDEEWPVMHANVPSRGCTIIEIAAMSSMQTMAAPLGAATCGDFIPELYQPPALNSSKVLLSLLYLSGCGSKAAASQFQLPTCFLQFTPSLNRLPGALKSITIWSGVHLFLGAEDLPSCTHNEVTRDHQLVISSVHPSRCCIFLALTYCYQSAPVVKCLIQ